MNSIRNKNESSLLGKVKWSVIWKWYPKPMNSLACHWISDTLYVNIHIIEVYVVCTLDMVEFWHFKQKKTWSEVLVARNFIKKGSINIIFYFYLSKLFRFSGQFAGTAFLVQSNIDIKSVLLMKNKKIDLKIVIIFLSKKLNIFLDPFLCNFEWPKSLDKLSVNIDHI